MKHKKIKNTIFIFDLLTNQLTNEIMENKSYANTKSIIETHFNNKSEIFKELQLSKVLVETSYKDNVSAKELIDIVLQKRTKLNESKLQKEKYNLVKDITNTFGKDFYNYRSNNYKLYANIYKLFENEIHNTTSATQLVESKQNIINHLISEKIQNDETSMSSELNEYKKLSTDLKIAALNIYTKRFNEHYNSLDVNQKDILHTYINNISHSNIVKGKIREHVAKIKNSLKHFHPLLSDRVDIQVKVNYLIENIDTQFRGLYSSDVEIEKLLHYHELIKKFESLNLEKN